MSAEPDRRCLPSGVKATARTGFWWPASVRTGRPTAVSHRTTAWSSSPTAMCRPPRRTAAALIGTRGCIPTIPALSGPGCGTGTGIRWPAATSTSRSSTVPSANFTATLTRRISPGLRSPMVTARGSSIGLPSAVAVAPAGRTSCSTAGGVTSSRAGTSAAQATSSASAENAPAVRRDIGGLRVLWLRAAGAYAAVVVTSCLPQPFQHAGAVADVGGPRAEPLQHRQPEVVERGLGLAADVAAGLDRPPAAADQQHRQVVVVVAVRVGDGAAERDHAVVQQWAAALLYRLQPAREVGELGH